METSWRRIRFFGLTVARAATSILALVNLSGCGVYTGFYSVSNVDSKVQLENSPDLTSASLFSFGAIPTGQSFRITATAVQSFGKMIVAGYRRSPATGNDFTLIRLSSDGTVDTSFGSNGVAVAHFGYGDDYLQDIALNQDDSIIAVGWGRGVANDDFEVAKFTPNGQLDSQFGVGGMVLTDTRPGLPIEEAHGVKIQGDGKIVVAGESHGACRIVVVRYMPNGQLDTTFGPSSSGIVLTYFSGSHDTAGDVAITATGKIVVAGSKGNGQAFGVLRLLPNGAQDTSFGNGGRVVLADAGAGVSTSVMNRSNGKIVAAGYLGGGNNSKAVLFQLNEDGTLDASFGESGFFHSTLDASRIEDAELLADGRVVAVGYGSNGVDSDVAVMSVLPDGSIQSDFGSGGRVLMDLAGGKDDWGRAVAIYQGRILIAANTSGLSQDEVMAATMDLFGRLP